MASTSTQRNHQDPRRRFAYRTERLACELLLSLSCFTGAVLTEHNANYDVGCLRAHARPIRVEVKGAHWNDKYQRYQFNLRASDADLILFRCVAGRRSRWLVVPACHLRHRTASGGERTLVVTSRDLDAYTGALRPYLDAWHLVPDLARSLPR